MGTQMASPSTSFLLLLLVVRLRWGETSPRGFKKTTVSIAFFHEKTACFPHSYIAVLLPLHPPSSPLFCLGWPHERVFPPTSLSMCRYSQDCPASSPCSVASFSSSSLHLLLRPRRPPLQYYYSPCIVSAMPFPGE